MRPSVPAVSTARSFDLVLPLEPPLFPPLNLPFAAKDSRLSFSLFRSLTPEEKKPIGRTDQLNAY